MGNSLEVRSDYELAYKHFAEGNRLLRHRSGYELASEVEVLENYKRNFTPTFIEEHRLSDSTYEHIPIFIVSMPRSGSSLLEQILSGYAEVTAFGEVPWLVDSFQKALPKGEITNSRIAEFLGNRSFLRDIRHRYMQLATANSPAKFFTDKTPGNAVYLWLIRLIFPVAKVISIKRDTRATAWSCFKTYFADGHHYSESLEDTMLFGEKMQSVIQYWSTIDRNNFINLSYETLVEEPAATIRILSDFLELEEKISESELAPELNDRIVETASGTQVLKPIYTSANKVWEKYVPFAGGALD